MGKRLSLQSIQKIAIVDNIAVGKVKRAALLAQLRKYLTLALPRNLHRIEKEQGTSLQNSRTQAVASMQRVRPGCR